MRAAAAAVRDEAQRRRPPLEPELSACRARTDERLRRLRRTERPHPIGDVARGGRPGWWGRWPGGPRPTAPGARPVIDPAPAALKGGRLAAVTAWERDGGGEAPVLPAVRALHGGARRRERVLHREAGAAPLAGQDHRGDTLLRVPAPRIAAPASPARRAGSSASLLERGASVAPASGSGGVARDDPLVQHQRVFEEAVRGSLPERDARAFTKLERSAVHSRRAIERRAIERRARRAAKPLDHAGERVGGAQALLTKGAREEPPHRRKL